jgi:hypothetical protein
VSARDKFLEAALGRLGETVLMGHLDCSELVALGVIAAGGPDQTKTHTAQRYFNETRPLQFTERPVPGDLGFYGEHPHHIVHVVIFVGMGRVLSADGATKSITSLEAARAVGARVREHATEFYRHDVPFLGWHRNTVVDALEFVTR